MGAPNHNLSTGYQQPGDAGRPDDTLDRDRPAAAFADSSNAKGSPAKGAHRFGDQGAGASPDRADPNFASNGE